MNGLPLPDPAAVCLGLSGEPLRRTLCLWNPEGTRGPQTPVSLFFLPAPWSPAPGPSQVLPIWRLDAHPLPFLVTVDACARSARGCHGGAPAPRVAVTSWGAHPPPLPGVLVGHEACKPSEQGVCLSDPLLS